MSIDNTQSASDSNSQVGFVESLRRWMLVFLGIVCVAIGAIGVIVPGLPTAIFLIAACYLFTRSFPRLEKILIRNRFFSGFHRYLDEPTEMPRRAKILTFIVMWTCICCSTLYVLFGLSWSVQTALLIPFAGVVGSCAFYFYVRNPKFIDQ